MDGQRETFEGSAEDIFGIKAGGIHCSKVVGNSPLIQVDVHLVAVYPEESLVGEPWCRRARSRCAPCTNRALIDRVQSIWVHFEREADSPNYWKE